MGDRISFRERGEGLSQKTTATGAVSITEPRVRFRKGWLTGGTDPADGSVECGDGSPDGFPMLVTMDQLHEIVYRVQSAYFTGGSITFFGSPLTIQNTPIPVSFPPTVFGDKCNAVAMSSGVAFAEWGYNYGYTTGDDDLTPEKDHLLDTEYKYTVKMPWGATSIAVTSAVADVVYVIDVVGTTNFTLIGAASNTVGVIFTATGAGTGTGMITALKVLKYRDYLPDRPNSMWDGLPGSSHLASLLGTTTGLFNLDTSNDKPFGFRHIFTSTASGVTSSVYGLYAGTDVALALDIFLVSSLEVAYVGADDPYHPDADLYLQLTFEAFGNEFVGTPDPGFSLIKAGSFDTTHCDLVFKLSGTGNETRCPVYVFGLEVTAGDDFECQAFTWWPYETTTGDDAFDPDTGLPDNGGPGA